MPATLARKRPAPAPPDPTETLAGFLLAVVGLSLDGATATAFLTEHGGFGFVDLRRGGRHLTTVQVALGIPEDRAEARRLLAAESAA